MSKRFEWYKHDPLAFLDGVQGMGPDAIGAYIVLLDLIYARGGECRRDDHHLSGVLGCSKRLAKSLTDKLISLGKIEADGEFLTNFRAETELNAQRMVSERRSNAQRVRREREVDSNENNDLKNKHISVKPSREEKRREEGEELTPFVLLADQKKSEKRGVRLPEDWKPSDATRKWVREQDFPKGFALDQFERFCNHWLSSSGANARKLDWDRAFINWMKKAADGLKRGGPYRAPSVGDGFVDLAKRMGVLPDERATDRDAGLFSEGDNGGNSPMLDLAVDQAEPDRTKPDAFTSRLLHRP